MGKPTIWNKTNIETLIKQYRQRPELWDMSLTLYRSRERRHIAMNEIAEMFDTDEAELTRKIHNLRNQMSSQLRKIKRYREKGRHYESGWYYFDSLRFLVPFLTNKPRYFKNNSVPSAVENDESNSNQSFFDTPSSEIINKPELIIVKNEPIDFDIEHHEIEHIDIEHHNIEHLDIEHHNIEHHNIDHHNIEHHNIEHLNIEQHNISITNKNNFENPDIKPTRDDWDSTNGSENQNLPETDQNIVLKRKISDLNSDSDNPNKVTRQSNSDCCRRDEWDTFGQFIANEIRNLKHEVNQTRIKRIIQRLIIDVAEQDDKETQ